MMRNLMNNVFNYIDNHGKIITDNDLFIIQEELNLNETQIKKTIDQLLQKHKIMKIYLDETSGATRITQKTGYEVDAYIINMHSKSEDNYNFINNHNFKLVK